jgi:hypothetical protein
VRHLALLGSALLALALAAPASAQRGTIAPPGNSSVDEYLETVPTSRGNRPSGSFGSGGGGGGGGVSGETRRSLDRLGPQGQAVADLARSTSPPPRRGRGDGRGPVTEVPGDDEASPLGAIVKRVVGAGGDDGGSGALLPVTLLAALVGLAAMAFLRRRRAAAR